MFRHKDPFARLPMSLAKNIPYLYLPPIVTDTLATYQPKPNRAIYLLSGIEVSPVPISS